MSLYTSTCPSLPTHAGRCDNSQPDPTAIEMYMEWAVSTYLNPIPDHNWMNLTPKHQSLNSCLTMVWDLRSWCSQCFVAVKCTNIRWISLQRHLLLLTPSSHTSMFWSLTNPRSHLKLPHHLPSSDEFATWALMSLVVRHPKPSMERGFPRRGVSCSGGLGMWFHEIGGDAGSVQVPCTSWQAPTRPSATHPQDPCCM